ncbi:hypothetical protein [Bacteroides fragilis]|uniref:hypothetical protein n=1 Tax=Bacteroides fragilis TaxID=817 RepID=UPI002934C77C|nr:hypothetical protein [Bacteroides fragilis]
MLKTDEIEPVRIQTIPSGCVHLVFHRGDNLNINQRAYSQRILFEGNFLFMGV